MDNETLWREIHVRLQQARETAEKEREQCKRELWPTLDRLILEQASLGRTQLFIDPILGEGHLIPVKRELCRRYCQERGFTLEEGMDRGLVIIFAYS